MILIDFVDKQQINGYTFSVLNFCVKREKHTPLERTNEQDIEITQNFIYVFNTALTNYIFPFLAHFSIFLFDQNER